MNRRTEILNALGKIESLASPSVAALNILNAEDVNQARLVKSLELDPSLTTNMLRFANSARYGYSRKIHSINEAVVRLGLNTIRRMIYLSLSSTLAKVEVIGYNLQPAALWKHLVTSAVCTEVMARKTGREPLDAAFTAALLHDIGKLVLGYYLEVDADPILNLVHTQNIPFNEAEFEVLGIDHAEVAAELLAHWNLPETIVEAVRWHHKPDEFSGDKLLIDYVHLSDAIAITAGSGLGIDGMNYTISRASEARMGLTVLLVEKIISELIDEIDKIEGGGE